MLEIITHLLFFHLLFFRTIVFNRCWTWRGAYRPRKYSAEMAEKLCFTGKTARLQSETRTYITIQEGFGSEARKLIVCGFTDGLSLARYYLERSLEKYILR